MGNSFSKFLLALLLVCFPVNMHAWVPNLRHSSIPEVERSFFIREGVVPEGVVFMTDYISRQRIHSVLSDRLPAVLREYYLSRTSTDKRWFFAEMPMGIRSYSFEGKPLSKGRTRIYIQPAVGMNFWDKGFFYTNFEIDNSLFDNPHFTGKKWENLAWRTTKAVLAYNSSLGEFSAGRGYIRWGKGTLFAGNSPTDGLLFQTFHGRLRFFSGLLFLDDCRLSDSLQEIYHQSYARRYLSFHRLSVLPMNNIEFSLYEVLLFGGPGRTPEIYYILPIYLFHIEQLESHENDNTFLGAEFRANFLKTLVEAEFTLDDFQIDKNVQSDYEPTEYAAAIGATHSLDAVFPVDFSIEYRRVANWTFNQLYPWNRFLYKGFPLSDSAGCDFDRVTADAKLWLSPALYLSCGAEYQRKGVGRIDSPWTEPWMDVSGEYHEKFPTGVVEYKTIVKLEAEGEATPYLYMKAGLYYMKYRNRGNQKGSNKGNWAARLVFLWMPQKAFLF